MATSVDLSQLDSPGVDVGDGRIPFRVRVGVAGHRRLEDEAALAVRARRQLAEIRELFPSSESTAIVFTVFSSLAEGADRLLAQEGLAIFGNEEAELVAVLPLEPDDYMDDFASDVSKRDFLELLDRASTTVQPPGEMSTREEAYWQAGRRVVDNSEVLIAIWDGEPAHGQGGTAEVVDYARREGLPVFVVPTSDHVGEEAYSTLRGSETEASKRLAHTREALGHFDRYNRTVSVRQVRRKVELERSRIAACLEDSPIHWIYQGVAAWALPHFARAEILAKRYQLAYYLAGDALFGLAALAVAVVGLQTSFAPHKPMVALLEAVLIFLMLGVFWYGRRGRFHDSWISYRSLAEAFRTAQFVVMTGAGYRHESGDTLDATEFWFRRAFSEAWREKPTVSIAAADVGELKRFLVEAWIDDQIHYHRDGVAVRSERSHRRVTLTVKVLLAAAIAVALMHAFDIGEHGSWLSKLLIFLAIALPGFGAAVTGHREQRQYRLHRERSTRTADRLEGMKDAIERADDLASIQALVGETQGVMLEENVDWYGVVELQDLEIVI